MEMRYISVAFVQLANGYFVVFLFCNLLSIVSGMQTCMYLRHFECMSASACECRSFKLFHYSAQLILLLCVSSFNFIIPHTLLP